VNTSAVRYAAPEGLSQFRSDLLRWLDENSHLLRTADAGVDLAEGVKLTRANQSILYRAGWLRWGWPEHVGGFGGPSILRGFVTEMAAERAYFVHNTYSLTEILAPAVVSAAPGLASEHIPALLEGREGWCQGFSEPNAGSDLASLATRAVDARDRWRVTGQKIWTSLAQFADKMVLLARTGSMESRHRGITAMLMDMRHPGVTVRPLAAMSGAAEFSEVFIDDVEVPKSHVIGEIDRGWSVAMAILKSERGGMFWMDSAWLYGQLQQLQKDLPDGLVGVDEQAIGHAFVSVSALRCRSWTSQHRLSSDSMSTQETSIDKLLMSAAEQEVFDVVRSSLGGLMELGDSVDLDEWRSKFMYTRAASIYGGATDIQKNIVADQLMGLQ
jgi:alkylation response protein AidB-like acyl-CoA dehydrogenase